MPTVTDWLMVGITFVYVIATIFICLANIKSAKATREQLAESKRQFDEENRPDIEVEVLYVRRAFYCLRFINRGKHNADHVTISFDDSFIESLENDNFKDLLRREKGKECVLGAGNYHDIIFGTNKYLDIQNKAPAAGLICYQGNGKCYQDEFNIDLENYVTFFSVTTDHDDLVKKLNKQNQELENIRQILNQLLELKQGDNENHDNG